MISAASTDEVWQKKEYSAFIYMRCVTVLSEYTRQPGGGKAVRMVSEPCAADMWAFQAVGMVKSRGVNGQHVGNLENMAGPVE